jgi:hypothetical protein
MAFRFLNLGVQEGTALQASGFSMEELEALRQN